MDIEMINPWTQVKSYHGHFERSQTICTITHSLIRDNIEIIFL